MAVVNGIYLPGWEYNRVLADDPCKPRNSALPGALFWNGAAPFWMFEKVYCTKESLDTELFAAQEIGWTTSRIFGQLAVGLGDSGPILEPVDWQTIGDSPRALVGQIHASLRRESESRQVRRLIDEANDSALERINYAILQPIAASRQSIVAGSMSGLRHWLSPSVTRPGLFPEGRQEQVRKLLSLISDPISESQLNGIQLLRHPRDWDPIGLANQDEAKERVETPFICDLQAGEGNFTGPRGFEAYILNVASERSAYMNVDSLLLADWERNISRLLRLRDAAAKHLWPSLHGDWLPALLREDPDAIKNFPRYVKSALRSRHFAKFLNLNTKQVFGIITAAFAGVAIRDPSMREMAAYVSTGSGAVALFGEGRISPNVGPLAVFYQEAFRSLRS